MWCDTCILNVSTIWLFAIHLSSELLLLLCLFLCTQNMPSVLQDNCFYFSPLYPNVLVVKFVAHLLSPSISWPCNQLQLPSFIIPGYLVTFSGEIGRGVGGAIRLTISRSHKYISGTYLCLEQYDSYSLVTYSWFLTCCMHIELINCNNHNTSLFVWWALLITKLIVSQHKHN